MPHASFHLVETYAEHALLFDQRCWPKNMVQHNIAGPWTMLRQLPPRIHCQMLLLGSLAAHPHQLQCRILGSMGEVAGNADAVFFGAPLLTSNPSTMCACHT